MGQRERWVKMLNFRDVDGGALFRCWHFWQCWWSCCLEVSSVLLHKSGVSIERGVHFPYMSTKDVLVSSAFFKGISYDKWPINMAMAFFFFFPHSKHWSIDVAAVCCQRFDLLWILQKLNHTQVISIHLKLHLNLPWNSCSMLPRAQPFLTVRVFSNKKEIVLKACSSFWPWSQQYSHVCIVPHF